ncbi:MAG: putative ABC transporter permease [Eubacteriales bacterium]|nr:putative ABC transporter permease [Eubacteriales bacterium]
MKPYLWYFLVYAFLGWCTEVVFAAFKNGRFVNRGFLNGPVCPIYGFGIVTVLLCLRPFAGNLSALYIGSVVLTTVLELATGFLMEKLFHQRWWDYSNMPLNIGGYVCMLFSLVWGAACVMIVELLQPVVAKAVVLLTEPLSTILLIVFSALFLWDVILSSAKAFKLDRKLSQIDEAANALRRISDRLGETMADGALVLKATDAYTRDELQAANQRARAALEEAEKARAELKARYLELVERMGLEHNRLLKAFPHLRSTRHPAALDAVKEKLARLRENSRKHP